MNQIRSLLEGKLDKLAVRGCAPDGAGPVESLLFPGAFAPLHAGHRQIARVAADRARTTVAYELSVLNADKPPLAWEQLVERLRDFPGVDRVWLTRAPTFVDKAQLFPGATFIVGVDTMRRVADLKYYDGSARQRDTAIATLAEAGCRFMVFGRADGSDFQVLSHLQLPPALQALCEEVEECHFRVDISSSELRGRQPG